MSELTEHTLKVNGFEYTVQLDEHDAETAGVNPLPGTAPELKQQTPANKQARTPTNKQAKTDQK